MTKWENTNVARLEDRRLVVRGWPRGRAGARHPRRRRPLALAAATGALAVVAGLAGWSVVTLIPASGPSGTNAVVRFATGLADPRATLITQVSP
jgi:hypothetical protein